MRDKRPKILVEIYTPNGFLLKKKKYPIVEDSVEIRPPRKGAGGTPYRPKFSKDSIINYETGKLRKQLRQKLWLIDGTEECVTFNPKNPITGIELPTWNREMEERLFKANVIRAAGATTQRINIPTMFYVMLFLVVALQFITLLIASGRVKFF